MSPSSRAAATAGSGWTPAARGANEEALGLLFDSEPLVIDVRPALDALPGFSRDVILTSGPPLPWSEYTGGQRRAIVGAAIYEGLANDVEEAEHALTAGAIKVAGCHDFDCAGSLAGVTSASMPVLVVEDASSGHRGYCTLFEGTARARLNYGVWNDDVAENLEFLARVIAPSLGEVLRSIKGGVALKPLMQRAVTQGDELHSRNTAASLLFLREIVPALVNVRSARTTQFIEYMTSGDYFFLRLAMAASKMMATRMSDIPSSSIVTAMTFSCREFGIRVSGMREQWFRGELPIAEESKLSEGNGPEDVEIMGGESPITEVCGLGGMAQATAFALQDYQGGIETMIARTKEMYRITAAEHPNFKIPFLAFRGTPVGIDVHRVAATGVTPVMDVGIAGRGGGQIGAGSFRAPLGPFTAAARALQSTPT